MSIFTGTHNGVTYKNGIVVKQKTQNPLGVDTSVPYIEDDKGNITVPYIPVTITADSPKIEISQVNTMTNAMIAMTAQTLNLSNEMLRQFLHASLNDWELEMLSKGQLSDRVIGLCMEFLEKSGVSSNSPSIKEKDKSNDENNFVFDNSILDNLFSEVAGPATEEYIKAFLRQYEFAPGFATKFPGLPGHVFAPITGILESEWTGPIISILFGIWYDVEVKGGKPEYAIVDNTITTLATVAVLTYLGGPGGIMTGVVVGMIYDAFLEDIVHDIVDKIGEAVDNAGELLKGAGEAINDFFTLSDIEVLRKAEEILKQYRDNPIFKKINEIYEDMPNPYIY